MKKIIPYGKQNITEKDSYKNETSLLIKDKKIVSTHKKYGNTIPFIFIKGEPYIVIGPNCIFYLI